MRFGVFGREDGTLVLIYKRRGIDVKMIGRKFNFQVIDPPSSKNIISNSIFSNFSKKKRIVRNQPKRKHL